MGLLATLEAKAGGVVAEVEGAAMSLESWAAQLEPQVEAAIAQYVMNLRSAFMDEMGYLVTTAWSEFETMVKNAVSANMAEILSDPVSAIATIVESILGGLPAALSALEQLAVHGLVSAAVTSIQATAASQAAASSAASASSAPAASSN